MACEAIYVDETNVVRFAVYPDGFDGPRILAEISADLLRQRFGGHGRGRDLVGAYLHHSEAIDAQAVQCFRAAPSQPVSLRAADFASPIDPSGGE